MTPHEALTQATAVDADDTAELEATLTRRRAAWASCTPDRIRFRAALDLCTSRGHRRAIRACAECRADIVFAQLAEVPA